jgi:hypothetical protein
MLYPMMDDKQRKMLTKIVEELKRLWFISKLRYRF